MTKGWLIPFLMAGLLGDKAFADCLPARDTPASVIEYFQRFNKPLPEQFCAKEAALKPLTNLPKGPHKPRKRQVSTVMITVRVMAPSLSSRVTKEAVTRGTKAATSVTKGAVMRGTKVMEGTQGAGTRGTKGAVMRGTKRAVTRVTGTMTAATIGKMTTRAIKAASIGKAMASTGNAMASGNPRVKKPT